MFVNNFFSPLIFHDFLLSFGHLNQIASQRKSAVVSALDF